MELASAKIGVGSSSDSETVQDCFTWVIKVHFMLERRVKEKDESSVNISNRDKFNRFQREVLANT